jgi:cytochrome c oxidase subunit 2
MTWSRMITSTGAAVQCASIHWGKRLALASAALGGSLTSACSGPFSTLDPASATATAVSWLWWSMFTFSTLVLLCVVGFWLYAMRRPAEPVNDPDVQRVHNRWIIGGGLLLPGFSILLLLVFGIPIGHRMLPLPPAEGEVVEVHVIGHQWWWEVKYPGTDIALVNEVHIPADVPVDIHLTTADVIHAFWVPRLGGKLDAIPGRTNILRLHTDQPGSYRGQCAEFCGLHHAHMQFTVEVHSPDDFQHWLAEASARGATASGEHAMDDATDAESQTTTEATDDD